MRHGIYLPIEGPFADARLLGSLAAEAEAAGWDGFFIWDELLPVFGHSDAVRAAVGDSGDVADALVALTAVAARTSSIRFGPLVTPLPRLRPEQFARQAVTLDRFSGGRLTIGVGLGNPPDQFSAFGAETAPKIRASMLDEFLELLVLLWSGETVDFHGRHYTAAGVSMTPKPLQSPRIPIWVGADSHRRGPRRRAARWDGFAPVSGGWPNEVIGVEEYEDMAAEIRARRPADEPFDLVLTGDATGTLPAPESLAAYAAAGVTWVLSQALTLDDARRRIAAGPARSL